MGIFLFHLLITQLEDMLKKYGMFKNIVWSHGLPCSIASLSFFSNFKYQNISFKVSKYGANEKL
jgi:hypothetical protein